MKRVLESLVSQIIEIQKELELSDRQVAEILDIHQTTWTRYKNGAGLPGYKFLRKIIELTGTQIQIDKNIFVPAKEK